MKRSISTIAILATTVIVSGAAATAGTVNLSYQVAGSAYGNEGWYTGIRQTIQDRGAPIGQTYRGTAGAFRFTDGVNPVLAFCMDPYRYLNLSEAFTVTEDASVLETVDKLFTSSFGDVKDRITASAFQVALWEVISESDSAFDVTRGNHFVTNRTVGAQAQTFLDRIETASTGGYRYTIYSNSGQDQISATPVPLPASALLLLGGLGGLGLMRRKRG